ncbi:F-box/LRR-repeat protein 17-like [Hibiscus syriacus]|uniref:F-box/LRR-repeat protein 17-like n=1 Tax=Hibiscus syriacus TaxID=106335 RepID=UPI001923490A|nr:F-box/LRR-repeat protein 17-like [Hibiscus syriacus]
MLSLVLGSDITDASVAAIASSYSRLELLDLSGSSISDSYSDQNSDSEVPNVLNNKLHLMYQKLIIKHSRLKKLSLWGYSSLDVSSFSP